VSFWSLPVVIVAQPAVSEASIAPTAIARAMCSIVPSPERSVACSTLG
jgi:hypothetical protein